MMAATVGRARAVWRRRVALRNIGDGRTQPSTTRRGSAAAPPLEDMTNANVTAPNFAVPVGYLT